MFSLFLYVFVLPRIFKFTQQRAIISAAVLLKHQLEINSQPKEKHHSRKRQILKDEKKKVLKSSLKAC